MQTKIGIVGYGHVGKTMKIIFGSAVWYDPKYIGYELYYDCVFKEELNKCDLAIICVPTPQEKDGSCDISIVEECVSWLQTPLILIKSAIIPGTTDYLKQKYNKRICVSPEYFGESKYWLPEEWNDPLVWPFMIIGGHPRDTRKIVEIFSEVLGPTKTYFQTDAKTAELVKYMENCWFAMMVTFQTEFYHIAEKMGIDYYQLREGWLLDPRIKGFHPTIFKDNFGFAGKCLPKDLKAIIKEAARLGYDAELLKAVNKSNTKFRKRNRCHLK